MLGTIPGSWLAWCHIVTSGRDAPGWRYSRDGCNKDTTETTVRNRSDAQANPLLIRILSTHDHQHKNACV